MSGGVLLLSGGILLLSVASCAATELISRSQLNAWVDKYLAHTSVFSNVIGP
ncbi:hypothetical protein LMG33818_000979 [Halomonadaceae bacterium LMG 33818]